MATNPDRIVQIQHLEQFLNGLLGIFIKNSAIATDEQNGTVAGANGTLTQDFSANELTTNHVVVLNENATKQVGISFGTVTVGGNSVPAVHFVDDSNNMLSLPLTSGITATSLDVDSKADCNELIYNNLRFLVDPHPMIFHSKVTGVPSGAGGAVGEGVLPYILGTKGTIVYYISVTNPASVYSMFTRGSGFYMVTDDSVVGNGNTDKKITAVEYIDAASPYMLYYCVKDGCFYRYATGTMTEIDIAGSGTSPITGDDYEPADPTDIEELINSITED